jgi:hypothetical protein
LTFSIMLDEGTQQWYTSANQRRFKSLVYMGKQVWGTQSSPGHHPLSKGLMHKENQVNQGLETARVVHMALSMSRPWKHPKTGVYWLRKPIPKDLRPILGKLEEKHSLETWDPAEAKRRHPDALAQLEVEWANLRTGPQALTEQEAHELAAAVHHRWLARHRDHPATRPSGLRIWRATSFPVPSP